MRNNSAFATTIKGVKANTLTPFIVVATDYQLLIPQNRNNFSCMIYSTVTKAVIIL